MGPVVVSVSGLLSLPAWLITRRSLSFDPSFPFFQLLSGSRGGYRARLSATMVVMHVVVCVKSIPDPSAPGALDPTTKTLVRQGKFVMDDSDIYGVEMGLQLAQAAGDGRVSVVSMVPNKEEKGVKDALAMGAEKAIVVSDDALAGSDALSTAKVLAAAIKKAGEDAPVDLVLAATESTDGYTGTTPVQIAELLGLPAVTYAKTVKFDGSKVDVERQTEAGYDEVTCPTPALVTVTAGVVEPRYPSFKAIMQAKKKPVDHLTLSDLGIDPCTVGQAGARQEITEISAAPERQAGEIVEDDGEAHTKIVALLQQLKVI